MIRHPGTLCSMMASLRMTFHARFLYLSRMLPTICDSRWKFFLNLVARGDAGAPAALKHLLPASRVALDVLEGGTTCAHDSVLLVLWYDAINKAVLS